MRRQFLLVLLFFTKILSAQTTAIGSWGSYYPYNQATSIAVGNNIIYSGKIGLLAYNIAEDKYQNYSKVNGLSDAGINRLGYNALNDALIIAYDNSNIDIKVNDIFTNLPDLKLANVIASKKITNIVCYGNNAYLSTGLGILVIDVKNKEFKTTYPLVIGGEQPVVFDVAVHQDSLFAITSKGVFAAAINNNNLEDIVNWKLQDALVYNQAVSNNSEFFVANDTVVFNWANRNSLDTVFDNNGGVITDLLLSPNFLHISASGNGQNMIRYNFSTKTIKARAGLSPGQLGNINEDIWLGDNFFGCIKLNDNDNWTSYKVDGPIIGDPYRLRVIDNKLIACGGGADDIFGLQFNLSGFGIYEYGKNWVNNSVFNGVTGLEGVTDLMDVAGPAGSKDLFLPSYLGGLVQYNLDSKAFTIRGNVSPIDTGKMRQLTTITTDTKQNNIWFSAANTTNNNLGVRKADGSFAGFRIPYQGIMNLYAAMEVDDASNIWLLSPRSGGITVFNYNATLDNKNDDQIKFLNNGPNSGNLISNNVLCITKDRTGKMWVGTNNGISIFNCAESVFSPAGCAAENKIVQYDNVAAATLFSNEFVNTIAIDGANRKWVGTNTGLYLISEDAEKVIYKFNIENSPLPSNTVKSIVIHPITGEVFIGTNKGIMGFRADATEGEPTDNAAPIAFPNPVPADYKGTIAIKNLVENAEVKIVDAAGQLVFKTIANGGQAVWNGKTYNGAKPQSGVYTVLITSKDGSLTQSTKFMFMH